MAKKKKSVKVRRKLFQVRLEELLEELDLFLDVRMTITPKKIEPLLVVDGLEVLKEMQKRAVPVGGLKDVKEKKQKKRPAKKSKKG